MGLGILVGINLNDLYHTFFAYDVSHCTPVVVTKINSTSCSINYGHFNIVGWGSGSAKAQNKMTGIAGKWM